MITQEKQELINVRVMKFNTRLRELADEASSTSDTIRLGQLSRSPHSRVRAGAATNPNITRKIGNALSSDTCYTVLSALLDNRALLPCTIKKLRHSKWIHVSEKAHRLADMVTIEGYYDFIF